MGSTIRTRRIEIGAEESVGPDSRLPGRPRSKNAPGPIVAKLRLSRLIGKLAEPEERQKASSFFGVQGPWYTVGYEMAAAIERTSGRAALVDCTKDMRLLLVRYNEVAEARRLPRWSPTLIDALRGH